MAPAAGCARGPWSREAGEAGAGPKPRARGHDPWSGAGALGRQGAGAPGEGVPFGSKQHGSAPWRLAGEIARAGPFNSRQQANNLLGRPVVFWGARCAAWPVVKAPPKKKTIY
jgi:hypothetical protein